jgi:hypothetical protein
MDEVANLKGLFITTGFSGYDFGIGPGAGKIIADRIDGQAPSHDLRRFRFARFSDGSKAYAAIFPSPPPHEPIPRKLAHWRRGRQSWSTKV